MSSSPEVVASAPGRVNLIGEHTDYNGGAVLPLALPLRATAAIALREDASVHAYSAELDETHVFELHEMTKTGHWTDYVKGVCAQLLERGLALRGFDLWLSSQVPLGAGLSSSAALEIALLRALRERMGWSLDDVALAQIGRDAEVRFVGANIGIMDQMAASLGDEHSALWLHTQTLEYTRVRIPAELEVAVIDSGVKHRHAGGGYNTRREECAQAALLLGVPFLCQLETVDIRLPAPLDRRVRHVLSEHARVAQFVDALTRCDREALGRLMAASHASLRDDFEVSTPELDQLVAYAYDDPDVIGARMTGGGFGGSIVVLARAGSLAAKRVQARYAEAVSSAAAKQ